MRYSFWVFDSCLWKVFLFLFFFILFIFVWFEFCLRLYVFFLGDFVWIIGIFRDFCFGFSNRIRRCVWWSGVVVSRCGGWGIDWSKCKRFGEEVFRIYRVRDGVWRCCCFLVLEGVGVVK